MDDTTSIYPPHQQPPSHDGPREPEIGSSRSTSIQYAPIARC